MTHFTTKSGYKLSDVYTQQALKRTKSRESGWQKNGIFSFSRTTNMGPSLPLVQNIRTFSTALVILKSNRDCSKTEKEAKESLRYWEEKLKSKLGDGHRESENVIVTGNQKNDGNSENEWMDSDSMKYWEEKETSDINCDNNSNDDFNTSHSQKLFYSSNGNIDSNLETVLNKNDLTLTHTNVHGDAVMVDVGEKPDTERVAMATASITLGPEAYHLVQENQLKKGDVLTVAKIAGIMAAKTTSSVIPMCHNIPLTKIHVDTKLEENGYKMVIISTVKTRGKTGVEMEALTAVSVAALTVYDMCKAVTKDMVIHSVKLLSKSGGKSGDYCRED